MIVDGSRWALISPPVTRAVDTTADTELYSRGPTDQFDGQWEAVESQLINWGIDPSQLEEEDTATPSRMTISQAIKFASSLRSRGLPGPTRVVPDIRGGIVFEFVGLNGSAMSYRIHPDSRIELRVFDNAHRLVLRTVLGQ